MGLANLDVQADLKARLCIIASMLYYALDVTFMPDTAYDKMAKAVSEHWHTLTPLRQWQLGTREEIAASGFQCKITRLAADSAVRWMLDNRIPMQVQDAPYISITRPWRLDRKQGVHYLKTNEFRWRY